MVVVVARGRGGGRRARHRLRRLLEEVDQPCSEIGLTETAQPEPDQRVVVLALLLRVRVLLLARCRIHCLYAGSVCGWRYIVFWVRIVGHQSQSFGGIVSGSVIESLIAGRLEAKRDRVR